MRNFSEFINEAKSLDVQDGTVNYVSVKDLKAYLKVAGKFLSEPAQYVCQWLIDNNSSYVKKFSKGGNALADFYAQGKPKDESLQELYKNIGLLNKQNRILEIPVFLTSEQLQGIINRTIAADEVLLDLTSEAGKNAVVKRYYPLAMKIANSYMGKSTQDREEIKSAALEGLAYAIATYGKKQRKKEIKGADTDTAKEMENIKATTFLQYASYAIRNHVLYSCQISHMVRIPLSAQKRERDEKGHNTRVNTVSGEQSIGKDKDGGEGKTIFDLIGIDSVDAETNLNRQDLAKVDAQIEKLIKKKFGEMTYDIFASFFGLWGHKKMKNKDLAKKYGCGESKITYYIKKPLTAMKGGDKELHDLAVSFNELMAESVRLQDIADDDPYTHEVDKNVVNENYD